MDKCPMCGKEIDWENETSEEVDNDEICSECAGELYSLNRS